MLQLQRPLTDTFSLIYAFDEAVDSSKFATEEERIDAWKGCVERLDFSPMLADGAQPTVFVFRALKSNEAAMLRELNVGPEMLARLTFRLCLKEIQNGGKIEIKRTTDRFWPQLGQMLVESLTELLAEASCHESIGRQRGDLLVFLGAQVYQRSENPSPKS